MVRKIKAIPSLSALKLTLDNQSDMGKYTKAASKLFNVSKVLYSYISLVPTGLISQKKRIFF